MAGEVNIVLSGYRISLTADEAAQLARGVLNCLGQLRWGEQRAAGPAAAPIPASLPEAPPRAAAKDDARPAVSPVPPSDAVQQRTRALIQASIKDKGLSLREERRS